MSKFRIRLKVTGFELEIEGNREDASIIGRNIGEQMASLIAPSVEVVQGNDKMDQTPSHSTPTIELPVKKTSRRATKGSSGSTSKDASIEIQFKHDPSKYGTPNQSLSTSEKAMWFLYVAGQEAGATEMSGAQITNSFNAMFKQAKMIATGNVNRDLGKAKIDTPSLVGELTNQTPTKWFLTDEGTKAIQALISKLLSSTGA